MKSFLTTISSQFLVFAFILSAALFVQAQDSPPLPGKEMPPMQGQHKKPGKFLLQQLDLTREQIQQIRSINHETRDSMREAGQSERRARAALDQAIYSETANEAEVDQRIKEFAQAQSELTRLRLKTEFRIRQVLNAEQLVRFRELRQRSGEEMRPRGDRPFPPPNRPGRGFPRSHQL